MNYSIYFSPTGGTKKVADILASKLNGVYKEIDLCRDIEPIIFDADDVCLISVPSYGGRVPAVNIERIKKFNGNGAKAILNCVYGNRHWDDTLTELQDVLESLGFVCVAGIAAVAEHSVFRQFGTGRPDGDDSAQLAVFSKEIQNKLDSGIFGKLVLPGNHGTYKTYNGAPFKPEGSESCISCRLCAKECPVQAISHENPKMTDKEKCFSCMRCIGLCPVHARDLDKAFMDERAAKMAPVLGGHKENYLFI